jgi:NAD(P)-dependent dehydrogenase (short-subunit alcohol dehydrogenase family)
MTSTSSLAGKRVLVTGGSIGIGAAIVRRLASQGATVAVNYRSDRAAADALLGELRERLDRHGAARVVRRVTRRAGISKQVSPHTLRHATYIVATYIAGAAR